MRLFRTLVLGCALGGGFPAVAAAHCDALDGPVIKAAQRALGEKVVDHVLIWVPAADEAAVRVAFDRTQKVRELNSVAREIADQHFFELVVRLHRASEGAPFTGLKPSGLDHGPAVTAADNALATESAEALLALLRRALDQGLHAQFHAVLATKQFAPDDVRAGREFVKAYVDYVHYVERLYEAMQTAAHGHLRTVR